MFVCKMDHVKQSNVIINAAAEWTHSGIIPLMPSNVCTLRKNETEMNIKAGKREQTPTHRLNLVSFPLHRLVAWSTFPQNMPHLNPMPSGLSILPRLMSNMYAYDPHFLSTAFSLQYYSGPDSCFPIISLCLARKYAFEEPSVTRLCGTNLFQN